jgi:hypothetical protein
MKKIRDIVEDASFSISAKQEERQIMQDDMMFAKVAGYQWVGSDQKQWANKPKPENNKLAKSINRLCGQFSRMELNTIISAASDEANDDDAELLQSKWRNDFNMSDGVEAQRTAFDEAATCGFGAMKVVARYEDEENPNQDKQNLGLEEVPSACTSVFYNQGAIKKDKSDATQCWQLVRVNSKDTEEEYDTTINSFPYSTNSYDFNWNADDSRDIYIAHYWEVVNKTIVQHDFGDGYIISVEGRKRKDSEGNTIPKEELDILIEAHQPETIRRQVKCVEYALITGDQFLIKPTKTPFKRIPVIPQYGYHNVINGMEYMCGEVARQRDNQRFLNMGFGALMEILAESQIDTQEYAPEQLTPEMAAAKANANISKPIATFSNPIKDINGNPIHFGPIGVKQAPQVGSGLATSLQFLEGNIESQNGSGQSTLPSNVSAEAVMQVNERQDDCFQPLFQNAMQAARAACSVWLPAAQLLNFSNPRSIRIEAPDGTASNVNTMENVVNDDGVYGPFKNSARGLYDIKIKAGESNKSVKDAEKAEALEILQVVGTDTPEGRAAQLMAIQSTTGPSGAGIRSIARKQEIGLMIQSGINPKPKTDEEAEWIKQAQEQMQAQQQNQQPDPMMISAMAQDKMAQAELGKVENDRMQLQIKAQQLQIEQAKLQQSGYKIALDEQKQIADIGKTHADTINSLASAEETSVKTFSQQVANMQAVQPVQQ